MGYADCLCLESGQYSFVSAKDYADVLGSLWVCWNKEVYMSRVSAVKSHLLRIIFVGTKLLFMVQIRGWKRRPYGGTFSHYEVESC